MKAKEVNVPFKKVLNKKETQNKEVLQKSMMVKVVLLCLTSFFITKVKLLGIMSPFGVSIISALPTSIAIPAYIGAVLGYVNLGLTQNNLMQICILSICLLIKLAFRKTLISKSTGFTLSNTLVSCCLVIIVANFVVSFSSIDFVLRICEALLCTAGAVFFQFATQGILKNDKLKHYSTIQIQSLGILIMVVISAFSTISIIELNLGIIIGIVVLNVFIFNTGINGGAIGGILLAISINLNNIDFISIGGIIIIASLLASVFISVGKLCQIAIFNSVSLFAGFLFGFNLDILFSLLAIIVGTAIFLVIPKKAMLFFDISQSKDIDTSGVKQSLEHKLLFVAEGIKDLQYSLEYVSNKLTQANGQKIDDIIPNTKNNICSSCSLNEFCLKENKSTFDKRFKLMLQILKTDGEITKEQFNSNFELSCCKVNSLVSYVNKSYKDYMLKENMRVKTSQAKSLTIEQFSGIYGMLCEMSEDIHKIENFDEVSTGIVQEYFTEFSSSYPQCVFSLINKYNRMEIEIYTNSFVEYNEKELISSLSKVLDRNFAMPSISQIGDKVRISIYEKSDFNIDFGIAQANKNGESICGDSYEYFVDGSGDIFIVLSDGMGSGASAAIDSTMACGIISKLVYAGLGIDSIIKFVNTSLQVKSSEESVATIDIAKINMYSGDVLFCKAGCASSYVVSDSGVIKVATSSLPIGILNGAEFEKQTIHLQKGNIIIMMSDGAKIYDEQLLKENILAYNKKSARQLAKDILANIQKDSVSDDDISIIVAKFD